MTDSDSPIPNLTPEENQALPLGELELTPQWVKTSGTSYVDHSGGDRESRREGRRPPNRDRPPERDRDRRPRPPRPPEAGDRRGPRPERRQSGSPQRRDNRPSPTRPSAPPVAPIEVTFLPEDKGFAAMVDRPVSWLSLIPSIQHSSWLYSTSDGKGNNPKLGL